MADKEYTILIIEDDMINREFLSDIVGERYRVITAKNGREGLDVLQDKAKQVDLILLDIQMPVMNGYEFLEVVGREEGLQQIPIVVTTALDKEEEETRCLNMGAVDFINKPYSPTVVMARIATILRLRDSLITIRSLEDENLTDSVTGLKNRRAYYRDIKRLEELPAGTSPSIGVVFLDVNGLKTVNDTQGHEAGDALILYITEAMDECFGGYQLYRVGGDEFVVLATDITEDAFQARVQSLIQKWDSARSAAVGAVWRDSSVDVTGTLALADKEMYLDKNVYYEHKYRDRRRNHILKGDGLEPLEKEYMDYLPGGLLLILADDKHKILHINGLVMCICECLSSAEWDAYSAESLHNLVVEEDLAAVLNCLENCVINGGEICNLHFRIRTFTKKIVKVNAYVKVVHARDDGDIFCMFIAEETKTSRKTFCGEPEIPDCGCIYG